jgi:hypothetical protein
MTRRNDGHRPQRWIDGNSGHETGGKAPFVLTPRTAAGRGRKSAGGRNLARNRKLDKVFAEMDAAEALEETRVDLNGTYEFEVTP